MRSDHSDPALWVHGVVSPDRGEALYAVVQMATSVHSPPGPICLPGLDDQSSYRVTPRHPARIIEGPGLRSLPWWAEGITLPGRVLGRVGLQAPVLFPERLVLVHAQREDRDGPTPLNPLEEIS